MTILGTRPEIIRLSEVVKKLDKYAQHVVVHTGQNYDYELNQVFFEDLELRRPDHFLNAARGTLGETIGAIISESDRVLESERPDALLVLGDTNSCLSVIPAKRRQVPIFHMEAGNRCFDQRVPEETNRRIVDHTADINMPYSDIARGYLLREGIPPDRIVKTGSPMFEVLRRHSARFGESAILDKLSLCERGYFLVSCHREENVEAPGKLSALVALLEYLSVEFDLPVVVSTHPRTRNALEKTGLKLSNKIRLLRPFGFIDYVRLEMSAFVVLSDSGTINEESSILNFPAVNIREAHERPEGMEEASVMMTGFNISRVSDAIGILKTQGRREERTLLPVRDYSVPNVSEKVARIILSYIDYVNSALWRKDSK